MGKIMMIKIIILLIFQIVKKKVKFGIRSGPNFTWTGKKFLASKKSIFER